MSRSLAAAVVAGLLLFTAMPPALAGGAGWHGHRLAPQAPSVHYRGKHGSLGLVLPRHYESRSHHRSVIILGPNTIYQQRHWRAPAFGGHHYRHDRGRWYGHEPRRCRYGDCRFAPNPRVYRFQR
ncbi:hypothetical protein RM531_10615 [Salinisphaera sp. P385]|uniref:Uncharacterized protein n=1 Tax=Spectribacter acetivorans TaxID=3075603 RepID=A0ABU3B8X7_9GAMM|nr:hypothetical protein [Salinisphaera sp. P385]MDT0618927.1 hypothetical protein [Salinisphaera sp. P385]